MAETASRSLILSIDQGTTNSKAALVSAEGRIVGSGSAPIGVVSPRPGWVEQDAGRIWSSVLEAVAACLAGGMQDVVAKPLRLPQFNAKLTARFGGAPAGGVAEAAAAHGEQPLDLDTLAYYRNAMGTSALLNVTTLYSNNSLGYLDAMARAVERDDLAVIAGDAHKMAGASMMLGMRDIGTLAMELEEAALAGDVARTGALFTRLKRQLPAVLDALRRWCGEAA